MESGPKRTKNGSATSLPSRLTATLLCKRNLGKALWTEARAFKTIRELMDSREPGTISG